MSGNLKRIRLKIMKKIKRSELIYLAKKYIGNDSIEAQNQIIMKICVARCARISYQTLGDNPKIDYEADLRLHDILAKSGHWSPFEHCARVMNSYEYETYINGQGTAFMGESGIEFKDKNNFGWCRNFRGFIQYRRLIEHN